MNIKEILNNLTPDERKKINDFINSEQGKNLSQMLSDNDKNKLLKQFSQIDPNIIKTKLNGLSKDDILKFIK